MLSTYSPLVVTPEELMNKLLPETRVNRDLKLIEKAAQFAFNSHGSQLRKSGEAYISHPFAVALIVDQLKLDTDSICGALLHDVLEDCPVEKEELVEQFGVLVVYAAVVLNRIIPQQY